MRRFTDLATTGKTSTGSFLATIGLIIFGYVASQFFGLLTLVPFFPQEELSNLSTQVDYQNLLGKNGFFIFILFPFVVVFMLIILAVSIFTNRAAFDWKRVFFSFGVMTLFLLVTLLIRLASNDGLQLIFDWKKFVPMAFLVLSLIPIQIAAEELLFRSYLMQGLKLRLGHNGHAALISGIMFGLIHLGNPEIAAIGFHLVFYYIMAGIFLSLVVLFDDGIELTLGYHAANNIFAALVITSDWQAFQTDAIFLDTSIPGNGYDAIFSSLVLYVVLFFIFAKKFNWSQWKEIWRS
ncbi:MAG: CPBP family intramembrane metalloprotease [Bacteroidetes bacterium]|nr:CPBP family intramembrane metalloprotease [Bacteroidota bacterium]